MSFLVPIAMFGFIPFVFWLYSRLTPRRAALVAFLSAWMFLPNYTYSFPGLPEYDKTLAASLAVLLATFARDSKRFSMLRPSWADALMIFWCATPLLASLTNGLGLYDGLSSVKNYLAAWFAPWLVGRLYFTDADGVRDLLWGVFLGALAYAPLCWFEMVMSPQLHHWVYGYHAHDFLQTVRAIGYRPTVFMQHGLMVGMWMAGGTLAGLVLWRWDRGETRLLGVQLKHLVWFVAGTFVACQSMGALSLSLLAYAAIAHGRRRRRALPLLILVALPMIGVTMKISGSWTGRGIVNLVSRVSEERAASFEFRVINELMLVEKAVRRPVFGWGGWGRSRIYDMEGTDISVTDSYWIIIFGETGIVGLVGFAGIIAGPVLAFLRRYPPGIWGDLAVARAVPLAGLLAMYFIDSMVNDMKSPLYTLIAGALAGMATATVPVRSTEPTRAVSVLAPLLLPRVL
ncbi:MAG: O-antigen ligase domain-containing protein [Verrucomicrobiae bacterium]|nr:O-antigen ligase domain-containing protein [Verrucomicrobiae bacterium]